eukprot:jgi/Chlat1/3921/Chrsp26S08866
MMERKRHSVTGALGAAVKPQQLGVQGFDNKENVVQVSTPTSILKTMTPLESPARKRGRRSLGRRVSFAEKPQIRHFEKDEDYETPPENHQHHHHNNKDNSHNHQHVIRGNNLFEHAVSPPRMAANKSEAAEEEKSPPLHFYSPAGHLAAGAVSDDEATMTGKVELPEPMEVVIEPMEEDQTLPPQPSAAAASIPVAAAATVPPQPAAQQQQRVALQDVTAAVPSLSQMALNDWTQHMDQPTPSDEDDMSMDVHKRLEAESDMDVTHAIPKDVTAGLPSLAQLAKADWMLSARHSLPPAQVAKPFPWEQKAHNPRATTQPTLHDVSKTLHPGTEAVTGHSTCMPAGTSTHTAGGGGGGGGGPQGRFSLGPQLNDWTEDITLTGLTDRLSTLTRRRISEAHVAATTWHNTAAASAAAQDRTLTGELPAWLAPEPGRAMQRGLGDNTADLTVTTRMLMARAQEMAAGCYNRSNAANAPAPSVPVLTDERNNNAAMQDASAPGLIDLAAEASLYMLAARHDTDGNLVALRNDILSTVDSPVASKEPLTLESFIRLAEVQFQEQELPSLQESGLHTGGARAAAPAGLTDCLQLLCVTEPEVCAYEFGCSNMHETATRKAESISQMAEALQADNPEAFTRLQANTLLRVGKLQILYARLEARNAWQEWRKKLELRLNTALSENLRLLQEDAEAVERSVECAAELASSASNLRTKSDNARMQQEGQVRARIEQLHKSIMEQRAAASEQEAELQNEQKAWTELSTQQQALEVEREALRARLDAIECATTALPRHGGDVDNSAASCDSRDEQLQEQLVAHEEMLDLLLGLPGWSLECEDAGGAHVQRVLLRFGSTGFCLRLDFEGDGAAAMYKGALELLPAPLDATSYFVHAADPTWSTALLRSALGIGSDYS